MPASIQHLYFHIPFCPKLCPYCSFYVEVGSKNKTTAFLDALLREVESAIAAHEVQPRTIYFGGGTPSALTSTQLAYLFDGLRARLDLSELDEWTLEANPARSREKRTARTAGLDSFASRQSLDDPLLGTWPHPCRGAASRPTCSCRCGITNLTSPAVLRPGQTLAQWKTPLSQPSRSVRTYLVFLPFFLTKRTGVLSQAAGGAFNQTIARRALFETTMDVDSAGDSQYQFRLRAAVAESS